MASWLIHQALLYPGVVEDIGPVKMRLTKFRRLQLGRAAVCRLDETRPAGMSRSDYVRRLIRGGDAIITACQCWICAGYISPDREEWGGEDEERRVYIAWLDEDDISIAERMTIAQSRTRISAASFIVRLGLDGPEDVEPPDRGRPTQSQRVELPASLDLGSGRRVTQKLRRLFYRGIARLKSRECCRRMIEWKGGEAMGVFGDEMPMPGTPGYDELASVSGVGPFELTERAARERESRIADEVRS